MATNYPASLDTTTELPEAATLAAQDLDDFPHSDVHGNVNDAVRAIEAELGTAPSGAFSTVKDRIEAIEAESSGTLDSGKIAYIKKAGIVHVWTTSSATGSGATMPAGLRPATTVIVPCTTGTDAGYAQISTAGVITRVVGGVGGNLGAFTATYPAA